ncbi:BufA1 family periplasmic bufferin-type metallophore [Cupriavidus necator]
MSKHMLAASTLSSALGLALAMAATPVLAQQPTKDMSGMPQIVKDNMARMEKGKLEKCYGINAVSKNDCAEGAHSCAGQATKARDTKSFVLLPAGDCGKIQGGKIQAV